MAGGESGVGFAEGRDSERVPHFGQPEESMQGMEVNVSVGLVSFLVRVLGVLL